MPKRTVTEYDPKGIRRNHTWYSNRDIEAIIAVAGGLPEGDVEHEVPVDRRGSFHYRNVRARRRKALKDRLESAAQAYFVFSEFQTKPTAKQMADRLATIEALASDLISALGLPGTGGETDPLLAPMPHALRYGVLCKSAGHESRRLAGFSDRNAVRGVYRLRDWAKVEKDKCRAEPITPLTQRHKCDEAMDDLFLDLRNVWVEIFERRIGTSVGGPESPNAGDEGGPMIRFFRACLEPILNDNTPDPPAIRSRIRRA